MNRIKLILGVAHLLVITGGITFYIRPSWIAVGILVTGFCMRWMAPVEEQKKNKEPSIDGLFTGIGIGLLFGWLSSLGLSEVINQAIDDRFSILPLLLFTGILLKIPIKDWLYIQNLNSQDINLYYTKN